MAHKKEAYGIHGCIAIYANTANPTWGDNFESSFKAQRPKLEQLFAVKYGKREVRALSGEL